MSILLVIISLQTAGQTTLSADSWQDIFSLLTDAADIGEEEIDDAYETLTTLAKDRRSETPHPQCCLLCRSTSSLAVLLGRAFPYKRF